MIKADPTPEPNDPAAGFVELRQDLLMRFARLAAGLAGTEAAIVAVGSATAVFGVDPEFAAPFTEAPVLTPDGGRIGWVRVLDRRPQPVLAPAARAALLDVAALVADAVEQERRRFELIQATRRAARSDSMLRLVAEAASCTDALTQLLEELCRHHDAMVGRIWRLLPADGVMQEISRYKDDGLDPDSYYRMEPTAPIRVGNSITASAILSNQPRFLHYSSVADVEQFALLQAAIAAGLRSQVSIPIWVQDERFGIALAFTTERDDLETVAADIGGLADAIRPALLRKVAEDRIRFMAHHDDLTQLPNRTVLNERLQQEAAKPRSGSVGLALLYLDLDGFKLINDSRGHPAGDRLLAAVADRLRSVVQDGDLVARIGGDEFAVIQRRPGQPHAANQLARRLLGALERPFDIDGRPATIGASIGIALHPWDGETADELQRNADTALFEAKRSGRDTFRLFERSLGLMRQERTSIERDLRDAIARGELSLAFQPIVTAKTLRVRGLEALLRWTHATRGPVAPSRFVPLAETSGLIVPVGNWALEAACLEATRWERPVRLSVNVSPWQFRHAGFADHVAGVLRETGLPGTRLDLEVTEGVLIDDDGQVLRTMQALREQGATITLDDFGTGHASLGALRRFPFNRLKIHQSFIHGMCDDDGTLAIVQAILSLSARLGVEVVAEGVEQRQELELLQHLECGLVQGYLTGHPVTAPLARELVAATSWKALTGVGGGPDQAGVAQVGAGQGDWLATIR
jgi:diguanylate cyclase (GGDEF)-like protein